MKNPYIQDVFEKLLKMENLIENKKKKNVPDMTWPGPDPAPGMFLPVFLT